jgi:excisionase family DNA binding protein
MSQLINMLNSSMAKVAEKLKPALTESDILTLEEAATYLKLPKNILEKQLTLGTIPGRNIGGHWRILKSALQDWLAQKNSSKATLLAMAGAFRDDETFPTLLESIKENRKRLDAQLRH